jgi:integrase
MKPSLPSTVRELIAVFRDRTLANADIRPATVKARLGAVKRILKTWPGLGDLAPTEVTGDDVFAWAGRFKAEGTNFRPPGAKAPRRGNSATSVNSAIDALRGIFEFAVEQGAIPANPVTVRRSYVGGRLKKRIPRRSGAWPSRGQLDRLFSAMEANGSIGGGGREAADFCRFLLMSGARVGEVPLVRWQSVQWERRALSVAGFKSAASARLIPLFPELEALLRRVQARRRSAGRFQQEGRSFLAGIDPVFRIRECQKTIDRACRRTGMERITHHDFRHLFATTCIESGIDIPTVAGWLGHSDGGVLAMKVYGHLRDDHSQAAGKKVRFGPQFSGPIRLESITISS